jgi:GntR family transcriptional regulator
MAERRALTPVVDPQADRPVYKQIADLLRSAIATGRLEPGEQLPSEHELVAEHAVSRGTARQAIMLLRSEGLIDVVHGLGSFVREPEPVERLRPYRLSHGWEIGRHADDARPDDGPWKGDRDTLDEAREGVTLRFETRQLAKGRAPAEIAELLVLATGADVLVRRWETMLVDSVRAIVVSYTPWDVAVAAGLRHIESGPAVYLALTDSGHRVTGLIEEVEARMPTTEEAQRLDIGPSVPVFSVQRVNHTADDRPVEVTISVISAKRHRLVYELGDDG